MNTFIDSDIIFIHKNHPLFPGFEMCAMNRVLFFFLVRFFVFLGFSLSLEKKSPMLLTACKSHKRIRWSGKSHQFDLRSSFSLRVDSWALGSIIIAKLHSLLPVQTEIFNLLKKKDLFVAYLQFFLETKRPQGLMPWVY